MKSCQSVTISRKATEQYFPDVPFILLKRCGDKFVQNDAGN